MDAAVSVRMNATGMLSPTSAQRKEVSAKLAEDAAVRSGMRLKAMLESASSATASNGIPGSARAEDGTTTAAADSSGSVGRAVQNELDKEAFLQLLVLQLQNQDPLSPMDNADMVAQLAQFSALEGMTNLNDSFEILSGNVDQLNFMSASQLLGQTVEGVDIDGNFRRGVVESVHLDGSIVVLRVDGEFMSMAGITNIEPTDTETPVALPGGAE